MLRIFAENLSVKYVAGNGLSSFWIFFFAFLVMLQHGRVSLVDD